MNDGILILVLLITPSVFFFALFYAKQSKRAKAQSEVVLNQINSLLCKINPFVNLDKYPESILFQMLVKEVEDLFKHINYFIEERIRGNQAYKDLNETYKRIKKHNYLEVLRKAYIDDNLENEEKKDFFDNFMNIKLDDEQRLSIIHDEKSSLVVAAAGSGKTLTIAAKVAYLIKFQQVDPSRILLITFTDKACKEMSKRVSKAINKEIQALTFHKFGLSILTEKNGFKPSICDENTLNTIIDDFFNQDLFEQKVFTQTFIELFSYYLTGYKDESDYESTTDYAIDMKGSDLETMKSKHYSSDKERNTLKGEKVKSLAELQIANFLFMQGVQYEYEPKYKHNTATKDHRQYQPDFYLPEYDVYVEHFGIDRDGNARWLNKKAEVKYLSGMIWKRKVHEEYHTKLVETYSYEASEGVLIEQLKSRLEKHNVVYQELDNKSLILSMMNQNQNYLAEFKKLINTFIVLLKESGLTHIESEKLLAKFRTSHKVNKIRAALFLKLITPIFDKYQDHLKRNVYIDFSDMINESIKYVGLYANKYDYVIIDEYQDISESKSKLVDAVIKASNAKLFAVGDDWQSIFRFAGSDLYQFTSFEERYPMSLILKIQKTYRSPQEIIDLSSSFVLNNKAQFKKDIVATRYRKDSIHLYAQKKESLVYAIGEIIEHIKQIHESHEVIILGRYNFDLDNQTLYQVRSAFSEFDINFSTIHKAKGLEADHIILINNRNDVLGFPSKIQDDEILSMVLSHEEDYPFAEERRLYYVALTRARHTLHLLVQSNESIFIKEIKKQPKLITLHNFDIEEGKYSCPRCDGFLVKRFDSANNTFYGCSNYPYCEYSVSNNVSLDFRCTECGDYMVERRGKFGMFLGCASYPDCNNTYSLNDDE